MPQVYRQYCTVHVAELPPVVPIYSSPSLGLVSGTRSTGYPGTCKPILVPLSPQPLIITASTFSMVDSSCHIRHGGVENRGMLIPFLVPLLHRPCRPDPEPLRGDRCGPDSDSAQGCWASSPSSAPFSTHLRDPCWCNLITTSRLSGGSSGYGLCKPFAPNENRSRLPLNSSTSVSLFSLARMDYILNATPPGSHKPNKFL